MGFLQSLFGGKPADTAAGQEKNRQKQFEIFKYDGMRAQRMGRVDYAVKCFTQALALQEDFETMGYLVQASIQTGGLEEAHRLLLRMAELEPTHLSTFLSLANVCYMQEDYAGMRDAAQQALALEPDNADACYLLGKAMPGLNEPLLAIAHLTRAVALKEDYTEARLLRAETLLKLQQPAEAAADIDCLLALDPDNEAALLLRGRLREQTGLPQDAEADYRAVSELNPFNEQAYLLLGQLLLSRKRYEDAITLFDEAIDLNPAFAQAYRERGNARLLNGDKEGAAEDMKRFLELSPQEGEQITGTFHNAAVKTDVLPGLF
ncbi:MAG: tetratricopeptide repeat protein [Prevotellaceae bacterium]|jgi:tetratricopeptide (TPR) repeat protein|nr:tetratricopeptide repeat protein [Prevotellaceae bacterium]